jgi:hypothetical protein
MIDGQDDRWTRRPARDLPVSPYVFEGEAEATI